jgi:AcrR family transcriptional regulator
MIDLVADHGYEAITIRQLSRVAGVSTRDIYQCLGGKEQCFLHAYDAIVRRAERHIRSAHGAEREWQVALRQALAALAVEIAERPKAARFALVESFGAGPVVRERADCVTSRLEALLAAAFERAQTQDGVEVPSLIVKAVVAGMLRMARARLLSGEESQIPELVDVLWRWALDYRCADTARLFAPSRPATRADAGRSDCAGPNRDAGAADGSWWLLEEVLAPARVVKLARVVGATGCDVHLCDPVREAQAQRTRLVCLYDGGHGLPAVGGLDERVPALQDALRIMGIECKREPPQIRRSVVASVVQRCVHLAQNAAQLPRGEVMLGREASARRGARLAQLLVQAAVLACHVLGWSPAERGQQAGPDEHCICGT